MLGAELFVQELQEHGVTVIATLCGNGLNPFYEAWRKAGLQLVDVHNEQAAGYIAEMIGRLTRKVGVCAVSSGVAHVNAMTGVVDAYFDGSPMLLITGNSPLETNGRGHFQDLDHVALAAPVCKYAQMVERPERIPQYIHDAFMAAMSGRPGPVQLTLPLDVQLAEVDPARVVRPLKLKSAVNPTLAAPDPIATVGKALLEAQRPLLIAGSGLYYAYGEEALRRFTSLTSVPVMVPIWDRGSIPQPIPEFMGVIGAMSGAPRLLADADLILLVGAAGDYRVGYLEPPAVREDAVIVRIGLDGSHLWQGAGANYAIAGDPSAVLNQLADFAQNSGMSPKTSWLQEASHRRQEFREQCLSARAHAEPGIHALDVIEALQAIITDETILIQDTGNVGQWLHQVLCDRYPGHWLFGGASGVIGQGIPAAMAARIVYPDRPVILISGDGSFSFTIAELESAVRQGLPFVILLCDDQAWGIVLTGQVKQYGRGSCSELGPIRFDLVAEGFGAKALSVCEADQIEPAIREALESNRVTLIHVPIVRSSPADR